MVGTISEIITTPNFIQVEGKSKLFQTFQIPELVTIMEPDIFTRIPGFIVSAVRIPGKRIIFAFRRSHSGVAEGGLKLSSVLSLRLALRPPQLHPRSTLGHSAWKPARRLLIPTHYRVARGGAKSDKDSTWTKSRTMSRRAHPAQMKNYVLPPLLGVAKHPET